MQEFKNKVVIITGGTRGIGKELVIKFSQQGADVIFTYLKNKSLANKMKKEFKNVLPIQADVKKYEDCKKVVEKVLKKFKKIDILVNNAGIRRDKSLLMMDLEDWREVLDTNLNGVFNMCKASIVWFMKQKFGCIINISSVSGIMGLVGQTNYSASKAGIIGFSKALAKELASYNIRVNVVAPGFIETDMTKDLREEFKKEMVKLIPMKRFGTPSEVAELCLFLASNKASYITGEIIKVDGGLCI